MGINGPLQDAIYKVLSGQSITIFCTGDSTVWGATDGGSTLVSNGGWPKRLGILLGQHLNATVKYRVYNASNFTYGADSTVHTGSGAAEILIINGGVSSQYIQTLTTYINVRNLITPAAANADCVFIGTGINDSFFGATPSTYVPNYLGFIDLIKSRCTSAKICVTTQCVLSPSAMSGSYSQYDEIYNALLSELVGQTLPTDPPMLYSEEYDVWTLDTQQAFDNIYQSSLMTDHVHPNAAGYTAQANWMFGFFDALGPSIETEFLLPMTRGVVFYQQLEGVGANIEWSVPSGGIPPGLELSPNTGVLSGIPTQLGGPYNFTIRLTDDFGYVEKTFSGEVNRNSLPFLGNTPARVTVRLMGMDYPVDVRVKIGDQLRKVTFRA